jgi:hypothetical protein
LEMHFDNERWGWSKSNANRVTYVGSYLKLKAFLCLLLALIVRLF